MADFDPDAYLKKPFDPDRYLAGAKPPPSNEPETPPEPGNIDPMTGARIGADLGRTAPEAFPNRLTRGIIQAVGGMPQGAAELPKRAFESAKKFSQTGEYDPAPIMEGAMLTMGTGAGARGGLRTVSPPPPGTPPPLPMMPPPLPPEVSAVPRQVLREKPGVSLLNPDVEHALPAAQSRALSAAGNGGPLSGMSPDTVAFLRQSMENEGFNQHTIDQRLSEMSAHHFFGEIGPSLESDMGGIAAIAGPGRKEIKGSTSQRAREGTERAGYIFDRAFGENENISQLKRITEIERSQATSPLYKQFREAVITPTPEIDALMPRLEAAGALAGANKSLSIKGRAKTNGFPDEASATRVPTPEAFDLAKRSLDRDITTAMRAGHGDDVAMLTQLKNELISALDNHPAVGDVWKRARAEHAGPTAFHNSLKMGRDVLTGKIMADELPFLTASYTPNEMRGLRIGMRGHFENMLGKKETLTADTLTTALSPNNVKKMRWAIGDEKADALVSAMRHEHGMHFAPDRIHGNSVTANRSKAIEKWSGGPEAAGGKGVSFGDVMHGIEAPVSTGLKAAGKAAVTFGLSARRAAAEAKWARIREEASRIMTLQGPERDAVARYLVGGEPPPPFRKGGRVTMAPRAMGKASGGAVRAGLAPRAFAEGGSPTAGLRRVYIGEGGDDNVDSDTNVPPAYDPMSGAQITPMMSETPAPDPQGPFSRAVSRLTGTQFGEPRYQTWPEKMVRSGASLAGDVLSGAEPVQPPGLRREDYTDAPPPQPGDAEGLFGNKWFTPQTAQPNDPMMERTQDMAGLAGGQTLLTGAREAAPIAQRAMVAAADSQATGAPLAALEHAPKFYSALERTVEAVPQPKMTGAQWLGTLSNKGAKAEELQWSGLGEYLAAKKGEPVTKAEVQEHLGANKLELGEIEKGVPFQNWSELSQEKRAMWRERYDRAYEDDFAPGDRRRRPTEDDISDFYEANRHDYEDTPHHTETRYSGYQLPGGENYREKLLTAELEPAYMSSHWDEPNILAHRRTTDRSFTEPMTPEQQAVVEARRQVQGQLNGVQQQINIVARQIRERADALEHARNEKIRAEFEAGRMSGPDARRAMEAYGDFPELVPLQDKLQQLRAQHDAIRKGMPEEPKPKSIKSLHVEEMQSDMHQEGRKKGYGSGLKEGWEVKPLETPGEFALYGSQDKQYPIAIGDRDAVMGAAKRFGGLSQGVPEAPFKKNWHELVLKDALREAAEKGHDRISFAGSPETVAAVEGWPDFKTKMVDGEPRYFTKDKDVTPIVNRYMQDAPRFLNKIGKKHGVKVEKGEVGADKEGWHITPPDQTTSGKWLVKSNDYNSKGLQFETKTEAEAMLAEKQAKAPVHYMDLPQSLKDEALQKGFSLFEDSASAGAPLSALERAAPREGFGKLGANPKEEALTVNQILDPRHPTLPARSRGVEDIAADLMERGSKALRALGVKEGRIEGPNPRTDELLARSIASEVKAALGRGNSAVDWYTTKIAEAMQHAEQLHPELKNDPHQKMAFTAALAITSQGEAVASNVRLANWAYDQFKKTGRFPENVEAKTGPAMNANFKKMNSLLDVMGPEETRKFLHTEFTVKELEQMGYEAGKETKQTKVYGSAILGPKIGQGFYQNLNGNYKPVTMDLWFMRGWGRLTGTLVGKDMAKPTERFVEAIRGDGKRVPRDPAKLEELANEIVGTHERDFTKNRALYDSGKKKKSELTMAADRYQQNLRGINETPTSGGQRTWMRSVVDRARDILEGEGHKVTNADLQAIWWYPEKELYGKLGGRDSAAINIDYATAFKNLAEKAGGKDAAESAPVRPVVGRPGPAAEADVGRAAPRSRAGSQGADEAQAAGRGLTGSDVAPRALKKPRKAEGGAVGDDYNTAAPDEQAFQRWKAVSAPQDSGVDYDLRGAYLANMQRADNGHMGDRFKKPNHPTFSDQSQYAVGDQCARAGFWNGETFVPPPRYARGGRVYAPRIAKRQ